MRIQLLSFIPVGNANGPFLDQGELQRYLAEMICFPTAWLSNAIEWQAIDAYAVKATIRKPSGHGFGDAACERARPGDELFDGPL